MALIASLKDRQLTPEVMDQPGLDYREHAAALAGLGRLNRASFATAFLQREILSLAQRIEHRPVRVIDIASGGGDIARSLYFGAKRRGIPLSIHGLDISEQACVFARQANDDIASDIVFEQADVLNNPLPTDADIITCSLFLHHLEPEEVTKLLANMASAAKVAVLVSDLRRSRAGWWIAQAACRTLSRSSVVHVDGPRSVEGAFTKSELESLCQAASLKGAIVRHDWPWRLSLKWERRQ